MENRRFCFRVVLNVIAGILFGIVVTVGIAWWISTRSLWMVGSSAYISLTRVYVIPSLVLPPEKISPEKGWSIEPSLVRSRGWVFLNAAMKPLNNGEAVPSKLSVTKPPSPPLLVHEFSTDMWWGFGWPFPALGASQQFRSERLLNNSAGGGYWTDPTDVMEGDWLFLHLRKFTPPLPIKIWWGGFIADVLIFGLPVFSILLIRPGVRFLRWRKHRCPSCGYDLRATPLTDEQELKCSECGQTTMF